MKEIGRIILPILLATTVILGLTPQITTQKQNSLQSQAIELQVTATYTPFVHASLSLEPPVISVVPCNTFTIEIWLRDITSNYGVVYMYGYGFWDPDQVTPVEGEVFNLLPEDWYATMELIEPGIVNCWAYPIDGKPITGDFKVGVVKFHCESEGVSTIMIKYELTLISITATPGDQTPTPEKVFGEDSVEVHQVPPRVPPSYSTPVGGILTSANKLIVLAPYLALMGLVGAVSTYALKRRRRA